jgi:hypothetical protein
VLRAPLTMEWVATAEATEVSMMEWLLAASSCTERERVVRGNAMTRRRDDAGKAAARRPYRQRSGARPGGEVRSDSGDGGIRTHVVVRRSDSRDGAASDSGAVGRCIYGAGAARGLVGPARRVAR